MSYGQNLTQNLSKRIFEDTKAVSSDSLIFFDYFLIHFILNWYICLLLKIYAWIHNQIFSDLAGMVGDTVGSFESKNM